MAKASLKEYRTLFPYMKPYMGRYLIGFLFLILVDAAQIFIPQCIKRAIDIISSGKFESKAIYMLSATIIGLAVVISLGRFLWRYFIHGSSRRIETQIRQKLFEHLLTLSYDFYQDNKIGDLMARSTNDLNAVRMSIGMGFVALIDGTVMSASILVIMFVQNPQTAGFAILPLPIITLLILFFGSAVGKHFQKAQETYSGMSDTVQETFAGIRVVKSFVKEWWFIKKFADTNEDYKQANMILVKMFGIFFPLIAFFSGLTTLILLLVGGSKVIQGTMTTGELAAFFSYLQMLIWPMLGVGFVVNMVQRGVASLARINEIFNTKPSIDSPPVPEKPQENTQTLLSITNLSFAYPSKKIESTDLNPVEQSSQELRSSELNSQEQTKEPIKSLQNINLSISSGMIVGILGKTGSGKSTLLKTLIRMIDPPENTVFIKGLDIHKWDLRDLRNIFGVIPQDTYLFSDSIKSNIGYGVSSISDKDLRESAEISAIAKDLDGFVNGWDTVVGERGLTLSGGQKQRVAISRALARNPEILILDDSLSAVDAETERTILDNLLEKRKGKTTLIVSHRVSTLQNTDFVIVLEGGKIAESGSPQDLIEQKGFFAKMAQLQKLEQGKTSLEDING